MDLGGTRVAVDNEEAQRILRIDSELNKIRDYDLLLERVLLEARHVVNADAGSIYVKEGDAISIKFAQNDTLKKLLPPGEKQAYPHFTIAINEKTISGYVAATGELLNIRDVYDLPGDAPYSYNSWYDEKSGYKSVSMLTVPLKTQSNVLLGVIQIINAKDERGEVIPFTPDDETLVTHFAANATVALQRAYLTRSMIMRMIRMAELRDPKETGPHVNRVAGYALEVYERWAFKRKIPQSTIEKNKDLFKLAAMLHDVGKVAISDQILKKPARFTPEEYLVMQTHTCAGACLFDDPQSDFDTIAAEVSLTHHENWDGSGYPGWVNPATGEHLKCDESGRLLKRTGGEIPIWGRIVAVADVYDGLMSKRVYKEAWDEAAVLDEIRGQSGKKFDPDVVKAFFEALPRILEIRARFPDQDHPE